MRLKSVNLRWFRGAADTVELPANVKSLVVYGQNGAGKSSFIDGIEYAINNGKIEHLRHEYSGRHQERAVLNTHIPDDETANVRVLFQDDTEVEIEIQRDGNHTRSGAAAAAIGNWEYRRVILRQHEVSDFIHERKGEKYSALLPLFGLHDLEIAAENLRQRSRKVAVEGELERKRGRLDLADAKRNDSFGGKLDMDIAAEVEPLHDQYCSDSANVDSLQRCTELKEAIDKQMTELSAQNNLYLALLEVVSIDVAELVAEVRRTNAELAKSAEPLVSEKISVLSSAEAFALNLDDDTDSDISCPACGQKLPIQKFKDHIKEEHERLAEVTTVYREREAAISSLIDALKLIRAAVVKPTVAEWRDAQEAATLSDQIEWIETNEFEAYRSSLVEEDLTEVESNCLPIVLQAVEDSAKAPPELAEITATRNMAEAAETIFAAKDLYDEVERLNALTKFVDAMEQQVRGEIRERSQAVIDEISNDIMEMWKILHPGTAIDDVRLFMPDGDKAIDIGLTFHGKEQDSPRLTLSEGYRNSLGLCIFLAMAKREGEHDRPLILDDVVVSLDRDHRGMVAALLEQHFANRQVILMTHDRVWYAELRHQLDNGRWDYKMLLPFEDPSTGIRWSHTTSSFDDARALLPDRPDSAGNDARKIMDTETALIAEKLQIRLPYLRGTKNDTRACIDFVSRIASAGTSCLQQKQDDEYKCFEAGLVTLGEVEALLVSWGNRGSHSHDVVRAEAEKLLDKCEEALAVFRCDSCGRNIWYSHIPNSETFRCDCGDIRWRYGKDN